MAQPEALAAGSLRDTGSDARQAPAAGARASLSLAGLKVPSETRRRDPAADSASGTLGHCYIALFLLYTTLAI